MFLFPSQSDDQFFFFSYRYVHVAFCDSSEGVKPCSLVIHAPGEAQTDQCASAFQDAFRLLLTMWEPTCPTEVTTPKHPVQPHERTSVRAHSPTGKTAYRSDALKPGCVIPAGGTFEFLLHRALTQRGHSHSASNCTNLGVNVSQVLANALLSVPRQIYAHGPKRFLQAQTRTLSLISNQSRTFVAFKHAQVADEDPERGDAPPKLFMPDLGLESISCKYQLLLAVLQCVTGLLRVDAVVRTRTALHPPSHKLANISEESTDDETGD